MSDKLKGAVGFIAVAVGVVYQQGWLVSVGANLLQAGLQGRPERNRRSFVSTANTEGGLDEIPLVFGTTRVGGKQLLPATSVNLIGQGGGVTKDSYIRVIAHSLSSPGGIDNLGALYLDGHRVDVSDIDSEGFVQVDRFKDADGQPMVQIMSFTGTDTQDMSARSVPRTPGSAQDWNLDFLQDWQSDMQGDGLAATVARFIRPAGEANEEAFQNAFGGRPPAVSREGDWQRCYDPRKDDTRGGSGTHRADDPTTWEWSDNPALVLCTYMIMSRYDFGLDYDPDTINWGSVKGAADVCDETINVPDGEGGTVAIPKFRFSGAITQDDPNENIDGIVDAMAGVCTFDEIAGEWVMHAGTYDAPAHVIDETFLRGGIEFSTKVAIDELYNEVKLNYTSPGADYQPVTAFIRTNSAYVDEDGGESYDREMDVMGIDNEYRAQYRAEIELRRSREQQMVVLPCNMKALPIRWWDMVELDIKGESGLQDVSGVFRVGRVRWSDDGFLDLLLEQANEDTYDEPTFEERDQPGAAFDDDDPPPTPQNFEVEVTGDGAVISFDPIPRSRYSDIEFERHADDNGSPGDLERRHRFSGSQHTDPVRSLGVKHYRVRALNDDGGKSDWTNYISVDVTTAREVFLSESTPTQSDGEDGDLWVQYEVE